MASANRLMLVRHSWRNNNRIALMSVPAWPMPIHQTKLVMSNAQPTGTFNPHTPMPLISSQATDANRTIIRRNEMPNPMIHPVFGVGSSTIAEIFSVTEE
jgi:hypothetical protein